MWEARLRWLKDDTEPDNEKAVLDGAPGGADASEQRPRPRGAALAWVLGALKPCPPPQSQAGGTGLRVSGKAALEDVSPIPMSPELWTCVWWWPDASSTRVAVSEEHS